MTTVLRKMARMEIKGHLDQKVDDWINSIGDVGDWDFRNTIRRDVFVAGGCIASMLLGEPVRDYDLYFKTPETARRVAEYYTSSHSLVHVVLDEDDMGKARVRIQCSGGSHAADVREGPYQPTFFAPSSVTLTGDVQLIFRVHGDPAQVVRAFDFVHTTNYYNVASGDLVLNPAALEALLSRSLVYQGSAYPLASAIRLQKFITRGWTITALQHLKILWQVNKLNLGSDRVLTEQVLGLSPGEVEYALTAKADALWPDVESIFSDLERGVL